MRVFREFRIDRRRIQDGDEPPARIEDGRAGATESNVSGSKVLIKVHADGALLGDAGADTVRAFDALGPDAPGPRAPILELFRCRLIATVLQGNAVGVAQQDHVARLPNNRVIAIDAKVPLSDYTVAANETDDKRRAAALDMHAKTVRRHVESLSRREYHASIGETLDFVVLFVPGEHFLSAALMTDPTLFDFAAARRVYLASATILLPLLRAVAAGWKAERTEENAKKMHDAGVELFNRFVKVMELLADLGVTLGKTVEKFNGVIRSIDARLWPKGEEMQRMAGSGKELAAPSQIEAVPIESSKLRLTMKSDEPADVLPFRE